MEAGAMPTTRRRLNNVTASGIRARSLHIIYVSVNLINFPLDADNALEDLKPAKETYVTLALNIVNVTLGAWAPSAAATPQKCRPSASPTWWEGVWLFLTAPLRRVIPHGDYRKFNYTRITPLNFFCGPRASGRVGTMAMAIMATRTVAEPEPSYTKAAKMVLRTRGESGAVPRTRSCSSTKTGECSLALTSPALQLRIGRA
jgi:hypothetical protein